MGLDYCFQILKRLSFGRERDLFGVEPEKKIKTKGGSCKKTDLGFNKKKKSFAAGIIGQSNMQPWEVLISQH